MANIAYTAKYATFVDPIKNLNTRLDDEWQKLEHLDQRYTMAQDDYNDLLNQLHYAKMSMTILENEIGETQTTINELSLERDDMIEMGSITESSGSAADSTESDTSDDDGSDCGSDWDDFEVSVKERKTRRDIMTVGQAIKSHKSSKNHKLKPRSVKRDRTKSPEHKAHTKCVKMSHGIDIKH